MYIPMLGFMWLNLKTQEILKQSDDKQIAVGIFGCGLRIKIFNKEVYSKKRRELTGNVYRLVKKHEYDKNNNFEVINKLNKVTFDDQFLNPYEYELYMHIEKKM